MTLLDHGQPADTTTTKHHTGLIAVLAVLAVALLAAGAWLIVDHQQQASTERQHAAIMEVVTAYNGAFNTGSRDEIRAMLTDDFTWALAGGSGNAVIPVDAFMKLASQGSQEETFTGDPVFSGDQEVAIPTHRVTGAAVMDGTYTYTLREVDGQLKIASIVFTHS